MVDDRNPACFYTPKYTNSLGIMVTIYAYIYIYDIYIYICMMSCGIYNIKSMSLGQNSLELEGFFHAGVVWDPC